MTNRQIISFNKRFANGEQDIEFGPEGKIVKVEKQYYWQQTAIYNKIVELVEYFECKINNIVDKKEIDNLIYGKGGLVDRLVPLQREYNALKNRKSEFINRLVLGTTFVEDGSVDVDELAEEGLAPGKIVIYRQGAIAPTTETPSADTVSVFDKELDGISKEMLDITLAYIDKVNKCAGRKAEIQKYQEKAKGEFKEWVKELLSNKVYIKPNDVWTLDLIAETIAMKHEKEINLILENI